LYGRARFVSNSGGSDEALCRHGASVVAVLSGGAFLATSGGAQTQGGQTIQLVTKNAKFKFVDTRPRQHSDNLGAGDSFMISAPAYQAGKRAGRLDATCTGTLGGKHGRGVCEGVYDLAGGDIYVSARLTSSNNTRGAVTGGTGSYAGKQGTFQTVDRKGTKGGDPSDDTITLLP
jgi:hypothetical protein